MILPASQHGRGVAPPACTKQWEFGGSKVRVKTSPGPTPSLPFSSPKRPIGCPGQGEGGIFAAVLGAARHPRRKPLPASHGRSWGLNPWGGRRNQSSQVPGAGEARRSGVVWGQIPAFGVWGCFCLSSLCFNWEFPQAAGAGERRDPARWALPRRLSRHGVVPQAEPPISPPAPPLSSDFWGAPSCPEMGMKPPRDAAPPGTGKRRGCRRKSVWA